MKRALVTLIIAVGLVVVLHSQGQTQQPVPYRDINNIVRAKQITEVQRICDIAHSEMNGESEAACGKAQDATNTEYLCSNYGKDATCWVEAQ